MRIFAKGLNNNKLLLALATLALMIPWSAAQADTIGTWNFRCLTGGSNCLSSSQFEVGIDNISGNAVFTIRNQGPVESSITAIFWDDDSGVLNLAANPTIAGHSTGVSFSLDSNGTFPGGNTIDFEADVSEKKNGAVSNGINPDEWLSVQFQIDSLSSIDDLAGAMNDGSLRMGLHVQAIGSLASGGIETSMVTPAGAPLAAPEPASLLLLGTGIGVMGLIAFRRKRK